MADALRLHVNRVACSAHGACAELLPELITLDEWGYPIVAGDGIIGPALRSAARQTVAACPVLALTTARTAFRAGSEEAQRAG